MQISKLNIDESKICIPDLFNPFSTLIFSNALDVLFRITNGRKLVGKDIGHFYHLSGNCFHDNARLYANPF